MRAHGKRVLHAVLPLPPAWPDLKVLPTKNKLELRERRALRRRVCVRIAICSARRHFGGSFEGNRDRRLGQISEEAAVLVVCIEGGLRGQFQCCISRDMWIGSEGEGSRMRKGREKRRTGVVYQMVVELNLRPLRKHR